MRVPPLASGRLQTDKFAYELFTSCNINGEMSNTLTTATKSSRKNFVTVGKHLTLSVQYIRVTQTCLPDTLRAAMETTTKFEGRIFA